LFDGGGETAWGDGDLELLVISGWGFHEMVMAFTHHTRILWSNL